MHMRWQRLGIRECQRALPRTARRDDEGVPLDLLAALEHDPAALAVLLVLLHRDGMPDLHLAVPVVEELVVRHECLVFRVEVVDLRGRHARGGNVADDIGTVVDEDELVLAGVELRGQLAGRERANPAATEDHYSFLGHLDLCCRGAGEEFLESEKEEGCSDDGRPEDEL